jgi:hypothetical protein
VPKHDDIFRVKADNKVVTVAPKCHKPFRTFDAGGQSTLTRCDARIPLRGLLPRLARGDASNGRDYNARPDQGILADTILLVEFG